MKNENQKHNYILNCYTIISRKWNTNVGTKWVKIDIYVSHSLGDKPWGTMLKREFIRRVFTRGWINVAISANIRQSLTAVWKKDGYEGKIQNVKLSGFKGGGLLPLWDAKQYRCWHRQICPLAITWLLVISIFLGYSKTPTGTPLGSVKIVRTTKWTLNQWWSQ